jgi:pimeloyl-ACP methyl ester carboxylesterase
MRMANQSALLIHGMFMTPLCWEDWIPYLAKKGIDAQAPAWPLHDEPPAAQRKRHPDPALGQLTLAQVVDTVAKVAETYKEPPVLIGHSMGGLVVQLLLQRGLGSCGIAIDSAPAKGVISLKWSFIKSNWGAVSPFADAKEPLLPSVDEFRYSFCHTLSPEATARVYDKYVVPESRLVGRATTTADAAIDFKKPHAPLLFIAGELDHIIPSSLNHTNYERYARESGVTEFEEMEGRTHFTIGDEGWEKVADCAVAFIEKHAKAGA